MLASSRSPSSVSRSRRPALRTNATPRLFSSSAIRCDSADRVTPNRSAASVRLPRVASKDSAERARAEGCAELVIAEAMIGEIISPIMAQDQGSIGLASERTD